MALYITKLKDRDSRELLFYQENGSPKQFFSSNSANKHKNKHKTKLNDSLSSFLDEHWYVINVYHQKNQVGNNAICNTGDADLLFSDDVFPVNCHLCLNKLNTSKVVK